MADMSDTLISRGAAQFGQFVLENRERIIRHWITTVDRSPEVPASEDLTYRQLLDHLPELCQELGAVLKRPDVPAIRDQAARDAGEHGRKRWQQGYNLAELIREVCLIRNDVLDVWLDVFAREHAELDRQSLELVRKTVVRFFDDLVIESTAQFASEQIAEVRRYEVALSDAESSARSAKAEIVRHISHDLREPLAAISFAAQELYADESFTGETREGLQIILRNIKIEARHVDQLLMAAEMTIRGKPAERR
jgi:hypothetical protein